MSTVQDLREKAQRCRRLAEAIDDAKTRAGLLDLAQRYEAEAEALEPPEDASGS